MRILWHAPTPTAPSAYGMQTALFAPLLAAEGHEVVIAQMTPPVPGVAQPEHVTMTGGTGPLEDGDYVLPPGAEIREAFGGHDPDLTIVLKDAWVLPPEQYRGRRTAVWCNIDCEPMGAMDAAWFRASLARPVMTARWSQRMAAEAGLRDPLYVPHGIELDQWDIPKNKAAAKARLGIDPAMFTVGICAANIDMGDRKGFDAQFQGFAMFHGKHRNSVLMCHSIPDPHRKTDGQMQGLNLHHLAAAVGIQPRFPKVFADHAMMRTWFQALDVLLECSQAEGFAVPVVEAHACGVPVIATDCSALTEKIRPGTRTGWLVQGEKRWNQQQRAFWTVPYAADIAGALHKAARAIPSQSVEIARACRRAAERYDTRHVMAEYWKPALDALMED